MYYSWQLNAKSLIINMLAYEQEKPKECLSTFATRIYYLPLLQELQTEFIYQTTS